jgi:hypothetical protein
MEKHSPGPWVEENDGIIHASDGTRVGDIYLSEDANLVCAAPELLEALKDLAPPYPPRDATCHCGICSQSICGNCARLLHIHALIAKAEGK